jgi:hypothetical protein
MIIVMVMITLSAHDELVQAGQVLSLQNIL